MCFDVELSEIGNAPGEIRYPGVGLGQTGHDGPARAVRDCREDPVERPGRTFTHRGEVALIAADRNPRAR